MSVAPASSARSRSWPEAAQFNEAVQNLATSMSDAELRGGEPELGPLGMPMPYAGNFADVYKVHCHATGNTWAVKFFKREVRDLRERYRAISESLIAAKLPFMVDFRYLEDGVRISGAWYPLMKMRWIEGQSLNRFVEQSLAQPKLLDLLFSLWVKVSARLRTAGIAHADLQHGNVVLVPEGDQGKLLLKLIDYDGMYVPALAGQRSGELGHANYQHPQREANKAYNADLDRFSHLAICCALRCLRVGGIGLWQQFNNAENLLFTARDFADPANSALFQQLWTLRQPEALALVAHLALATQRPLEETPLLDDLIRDDKVRPLSDAEERAAQSLLGIAPVQRDATPAPVPTPQAQLIPLTPQPPSLNIVGCPRCAAQVTAPPGASFDMQVRCPMCGSQYYLSEAIGWQPPQFQSEFAQGFAPSPLLQPDAFNGGFAEPFNSQPLTTLPTLSKPLHDQPPPRGITAPVVWADRLLGRLAGQRNRVLHNSLRVAVGLIVLIAGAWSLGAAAGAVYNLVVPRPTSFAEVDRTRQRAFAAASQGQRMLALPAGRDKFMQGQRLMHEAHMAANQQRFDDSKRLYEQAIALFSETPEAPPVNLPNTGLGVRQSGSVYPNLPQGAGPIDRNLPTAFLTTPSGLRYRILRQGNGKRPGSTSQLGYSAHGWLDNGQVFSIPVNGLTAVDEGVRLATEQGMIELEVPPALYRNRNLPGVPPGATLHIVVELTSVR